MISRNKNESDKALRKCNYECIVCGYNKIIKGHHLVVGAHVRAFESGNEFDVASNIIALCPNCHAEYDSYMFYIEPKTKHLIYLDESNPFHNKDVSNKIMYVDDKFLAYNTYLFKKNNGLL